MKKVFFMLLLMLIMPLVVSANYIGEIKRSIHISVNCELCPQSVERSATFQLFANDKIVEGQKLILNEENNFEGSFKDLNVFDDNNEEIVYEVKKEVNGSYESIPKEDISYEKSAIKKWVQVMPEDIEPGHKYVLFTDNWNYEQNGHGKFVLMTGNMSLEEIEVVPEYNIINGKKSYFTLVGEPSEEAIWTTSSVSKDDEEYEIFKDYIMFNSYENKRLTLAGYNKGDWVDWIYKQSGKEGYYIDYEDAWYTNKVRIEPIIGTIGRFHIASQNINSYGDLSPTHYVGVDHFYNIAAQTEREYSAQFLAFEYIESEEVETVYNMKIGTVLCKNMVISPDTGNKNIVLVIGIFALSFLVIVTRRKNRFE